jgi:periplasmic protein TonB
MPNSAARPGPKPGPGRDAGDVFQTGALDEKPVWTGLYENIHDRLFPPKFPPLELTSTPIPVIDRMAVKTNPWAVGTSTIVNAGILAILVLLGLKEVTGHFTDPAPRGPIDLSQWKLPALSRGNQAIIYLTK